MIFSMVYKNLLQIKNGTRRMVISILFVVVAIFSVGYENGMGARVSAKAMNYFIYVLSITCSLDLLMNNLAYEKRERTLDIVLVVVKKKWKIIFAEGISTVILAAPFLFISQLILAVFNWYFETLCQRQGFFYIETSVISWAKIMILVYIFSICTIIALEWLQDEKTSIFLAMILAFTVSIFVFLFSNEWIQMIISLGMAFILTIIAAKLLIRYIES